MKKTTSRTSQTNGLLIFLRLCLLFMPHWHWIGIGLFFSLLTIVANVALMAISGWFIASMAVAGLTGAMINYFTPAAGIRACAIGRAASRYAERLVTHDATLRMLASLRHWFYIHLEPLAPAVLQKYHSGDLLSRIRADIDTLEHAYLRTISPIATAIIASTLFVLFLSIYSNALAVVELFFLFCGGIIVPLIILRLSREPGKALVETSAAMRQTSMDSMQGMGELLIYGAAEKQETKFDEVSQELVGKQAKMSHLNGISQAALVLCTGFALLLVITIAIPIIESGGMEPVHLAMLALFTMASFEAVQGMPQAFQRVPETIMAARRVFAIVDAKPLVSDPQTPSPLPANVDIEFKNVSFSYEPQEENVLEQFNLTLKTGEHLAITGSSGVGKSSIVNLLLRFWEVDEGEILFGGYPLKKYQGEDIRSYFSVAAQQSHFFNNTIRENLLLADRHADDEQLEEVCRVAQIHNFITTLPEGYDTWMGEAGLKLSGGQLKRLTVARALLKPAKVLILDEPGEGLNRELEKELLDAVFSYKKECSILLITHSEISGLSTLNMS